jgi:hypothetical protein
MVPPRHVPPSRAAESCSRRVTRLLAAALPLLATACVTTSGDLGTACEAGNTYACSDWGGQLLRQGEKQQAENAFARSCDAGNIDDCTSAGRLMLERGELAGAEAPLRKGYEVESQQATRALADLYQARGEPGDGERVQQLRFEELAIEKPDREFIFWWRPSPTRETTYALAYFFQPMELWSRRMALGLHFAGNAQGGREINLAASYQHFLTPELVPYGTLLIGGGLQQKTTLNVGGEVGVKWCLGPFGHLNLGGGISVVSPLHVSVGIGVNSLPIELLLLLAH